MLNLSLYLKGIKVIFPMQSIKLLVHFVSYVWDTVGYFDDPWGNLIFFFFLTRGSIFISSHYGAIIFA